MAPRTGTRQSGRRKDDEARVAGTRLDARGLALRAALIARRTETEARLRTALATARDRTSSRSDAAAPDEGDQSADALQREISFAAMQAQSDLLHRIDEALERLARGEYGRCRECGDDIADGRLQALPFAVRCVECERRRERAHAASRRFGTSRLAAMAGTGPVDLA